MNEAKAADKLSDTAGSDYVKLEVWIIFPLVRNLALCAFII